MRTPLIATLLIVALTTGQPAAAAPVSVTRDDQRDVMVTIYNGNLGLVKDLREVRFPAGQTEVQFMDVAALIDPTTVHLKSITDAPGLKILEQNYEYDLLTSQKLMEKYVGHKVRLYQSDGTYHEATLLSTDGPVFEINGQIHMGHYGRLVLPSLPENLVSKPTLVWLLRNQTGAAAARGGLVSHERDHVEGRLRDGAERRRHAVGPHRLGDDRQQERRHLRQRRAQAGRRRRESGAGRAPRSADDGAGGQGGVARGRQPRLRVGRLLRVSPLHARRPHDDQGQPDQAALAAVVERDPDHEGADLLRRRRLLPQLPTVCRSRIRRWRSISR